MSHLTPEQQEAYDTAAARIAQAERDGETELNLGLLGLTELPPEIGRLTGLRVLRLWDNRLTAVPDSLRKLTQLQSLYLSFNLLTAVPDSLRKLTQLQILDLRSNQLTAVPDCLRELTQLQHLYLGDNQLTAVPDWLGELTQLQTLSLSRNRLTAVPGSLRKLTQLQHLDLGGNRLTAVPDWLRELTQLRVLGIVGFKLTVVPDWLRELTQLQTLGLGDNQLTAVPDWMRELTQLQSLNLGGNQLTAVPDWLRELTQLRKLYLNDNQLTAIPDWLRKLTQLRELYLSDNQLTAVPDWSAEMPQLKALYIRRNPITQPPPEQLGKALTGYEPVDLDALRRYFAQLRRAGEAYFYEAKLLIVGEGGSGKTSLARKLRDTAAALPTPEDSTDGIDIQTWSFPLDQDLRGFENLGGLPPDQYHVNIWDFGGQTVYHATHQFFLTKRSVYVLVADTRQQHTDFYDWLKMQETFGGNSPIILLKNRNRQRGNDCVIENLPHLQDRFPNLKEVVEIDLDNVPDEADWPDLLRYLQKHFLALDHIGVARPKTWVEVRKTLDADPRDTISRDEYLSLCAEQGIPDPLDALQLSDYLHHLGDILHFQDDPVLTDLVILKPTWGLDAVYRVLDNKEIGDAHGQFTLAQLRHLWHEELYTHHRTELLRLMQNFQLCYPLRDKDNDTYIAPQLLDIETPEYAWVGNQDDLQLRYSYPLFMPRGILSRAIVALHHHITDQQQVWRTGVILHDQYAHAELLELRGEREIRIRVSGGNKRDLLMEIVRTLDELHRSFPKLQYDKLVPCNCPGCAATLTPHFFNLGKLLERLKNRKETVECENPPYAEVQIRSLVDDVILQTRVSPQETTHNYYGPVHQGKDGIMTNTTDNRGAGDNITVGDISGSSGVAVGAGAASTVHNSTSGDTFNLSGDFRGANVNIKSRLENVRQTIGALPHADDAAKAELQQLIAQLNDALQEAPQDKTEDAEAVAQMAETLVETANSEKPNKLMVQITGDGLKKAAENMAAVMPTVLGIAMQIVTAVAALAG